MIRTILSISVLKISELSKRFLLFLILISVTNGVFSQSFAVGHTTRAYVDTSRNRTIDVEIYYPSTTAGDNVAVASGNFPVLVFGHWFLMTWSAYKNFWEALVPEGYIMCFQKQREVLRQITVILEKI